MNIKNLKQCINSIAYDIYLITGGKPILPIPPVEELITEMSIGMTWQQKSEYWYELTQNIFQILGRVDPTLIEIQPHQWVSIAKAHYPTLTDIKIADSKFFTCSLADLQKILSRDWTNLVPYVVEKQKDCDDAAIRLYSHLCDYYDINAIVPVWGDTTAGYHAFNLAVIREGDGSLIARLVEPQTDAIFEYDGPLGHYVPKETSQFLSVLKLPVKFVK